MPKLKAFTTENLAIFDNGVIREVIDHHIRRSASDCKDRPTNDKERAVNVQLLFKPVTDDKGRLVAVKSQIKVASTTPKHQTRVFDLGVTENGTFVFNPNSLDNVDQETMFEDEDDDN